MLCLTTALYTASSNLLLVVRPDLVAWLSSAGLGTSKTLDKADCKVGFPVRGVIVIKGFGGGLWCHHGTCSGVFLAADGLRNQIVHQILLTVAVWAVSGGAASSGSSFYVPVHNRHLIAAHRSGVALTGLLDTC